MSMVAKLREMRVAASDTGDIASIKKHRPRDVATNPSY